MSGPIRKVGGVGGLPGDAGDVASSGEAFRGALDAARPAEAARSVDGSRASDVAELAAAVKGGAIEPSAVVDRLVERALAAPAARGLTDAGRAELERSLRSALAEDPTLLALQADLGRGA